MVEAVRLLARGGDHRLGEVDAHDLAGAELAPRPRIDAAAAADIGHSLGCRIDDVSYGVGPAGIGQSTGIGASIRLRVEIDRHPRSSPPLVARFERTDFMGSNI